MKCGTLVPLSGVESVSPVVEGRVLTPGLPGKSSFCIIECYVHSLFYVVDFHFFFPVFALKEIYLVLMFARKTVGGSPLLPSWAT